MLELSADIRGQPSRASKFGWGTVDFAHVRLAKVIVCINWDSITVMSRHLFRHRYSYWSTYLSSNAISTSGCVSIHTGAVLGLAAQEELARNYYQVLGVGRNATKKEIRTAFVSLSKKYHPDSNPAQDPNSRAFVAVCEAYHTLSSPKRRAQYDTELTVAETYRTQYEQRFYRGSDATQSEVPFKARDQYSSGGSYTSHQYYQYDQNDVDWELYRQSVKRPKHSRILYVLLAISVLVPALFMLRVNHTYRKYYQPAAILESQRNMEAYKAVRDRARKSSVQEQLDLLVARHAKTVDKADSGPPNR